MFLTSNFTPSTRGQTSNLISLFVFVFGLGGIFRSFRSKNEALNYLIGFTVITPLILFVSVGETRYRFQIYPLLAIFSAYFVSLFKLDKKLWFKNLLVSSVVILSNGMFDGLLNFNSFKDKIFSYFG